MNIAKTEDYDKIQKNDANTLSMLLSGQVPNTSNLNYLLWNIEDPALRSNTALKKDYHPSLIDFSQKLISIQDVGLISCI